MDGLERLNDLEQDRWVAILVEYPDILLVYRFGYHAIPERYLA